MDELEKKMASIQWTYGDKDPVALTVLEKHIAETGRRLSFITYSDLVKEVVFNLPNVNEGKPYRIKTFDWTGLDRKIIGDFLGYISYCTYSKHGFMASALVVNGAEFQPSWHFFSWMKQLGVLPDLENDTVLKFWADESNKAHNWYKANRRRS